MPFLAGKKNLSLKDKFRRTTYSKRIIKAAKKYHFSHLRKIDFQKKVQRTFSLKRDKKIVA